MDELEKFATLSRTTECYFRVSPNAYICTLLIGTGSLAYNEVWSDAVQTAPDKLSEV